MKIAQVIRHYNKTSGSSRVVAELSENFLELGHEVHVYTHSWPKNSPKGISFHWVPVFKLNFPFEVSSFTYFSTAFLKNSNYDVVNNHGDCRHKGIFTSHGCHTFFVKKILKGKGSSLDRYIMNLEEYIYGKRNYTKVIALSNVVKKQIMDSYDVPEKDIAVIYNGINLNDFSQENLSPLRKPVRERYGIGDDEIVLLFVGHDFGNKGLDVILDALLISKNKNFKLFVVGKDRNRKNEGYYMNKADVPELKGKVIFIGATSKVQEFYAASDIFLLPSMAEACALVQFEAMASGLPVIVSSKKINGSAEIVEEGKDGFILADFKNAEELAFNIDRLLDSPRSIKEMGNTARQKMQDYSWKKVAEKTLEVYKSTL